MIYEPIFVNEAWHAAYQVPGVKNAWTSVVECPDEKSAVASCDQLNRASKRFQKQLRREAELCGIRP